MVSIKVSEKTLELLKCLKEEEQIKTLDGSIRYLLSCFDWLKMTSVRINGRLVPVISPEVEKLRKLQAEREEKIEGGK